MHELNLLRRRVCLLAASFWVSLLEILSEAAPQGVTKPTAPVITKVEPPNWWVGLTPEVLLLLSGHDLEATHVGCNLPTLRVSRTQASAGGNYLFIWLKIGADTKSGTAVC